MQDNLNNKEQDTIEYWGINKEWCLFLDRDGVINKRLADDYVKHPSQFLFMEGVLDALKVFSASFRHIFIVTNQQGIGKGLMTEEDLELVHRQMLLEITQNQGRITSVYYAPEIDSSDPYMRKPGPGMAYKARDEFKGVDFSRSIMAGDTLNDMEFGSRLGMKTVLIDTDDTHLDTPIGNAFDLKLGSLEAFAELINSINH